jgi:hypothetical protein
MDMARDFGEGEEWDPAEAADWEDEDFEYNCNYLLDRGADVPGTAENKLLIEIVTNRVGEDKVEETLQEIYERRFGAAEAAPAEEAEGVPADEFQTAEAAAEAEAAEAEAEAPKGRGSKK